MRLGRKRWWIIGVWIACFSFGFFVWRILHTGSFAYRSHPEVESIDDLDLSVYVGEHLISRSDIDWEYKFYIQQLYNLNSSQHHEGEPPQSTNSPLLAKQDQEADELKPNVELYNKILSNLIERKLLFQYISQDQRFTLEEPARYTACLSAWQQATQADAEFFREEKARTQLKSMLCEKDILEQYIRERIMASIEFSTEAIEEYYSEHKADFSQPTRVVIRQVLAPSEADAKKVRARINSQNFAAMAAEFSIAPEASLGGVLGPFAKGEMPSLFDIAFEMSPGEIQGILKSTYGFHIIMLEKKLPKVQLSLEAARHSIVQILSKKRQEEEYQKWVEMALNNIPIKSSRNF